MIPIIVVLLLFGVLLILGGPAQLHLSTLSFNGLFGKRSGSCYGERSSPNISFTRATASENRGRRDRHHNREVAAF
jgi:hypothetical protein